MLPAGRRVRRNDDQLPPAVAPNATEQRDSTSGLPLSGVTRPPILRAVDLRGALTQAPAAPVQDERPVLRMIAASPSGTAPIRLSRRSEPPILAPAAEASSPVVQRSPVSDGDGSGAPAAIEPASAANPTTAGVDVQALVEQVYTTLLQRLADERERRGW